MFSLKRFGPLRNFVLNLSLINRKVQGNSFALLVYAVYSELKVSASQLAICALYFARVGGKDLNSSNKARLADCVFNYLPYFPNLPTIKEWIQSRV